VRSRIKYSRDFLFHFLHSGSERRRLADYRP
jgi:hypothetical protein